mgnify:FL=1
MRKITKYGAPADCIWGGGHIGGAENENNYRGTGSLFTESLQQ